MAITAKFKSDFAWRPILCPAQRFLPITRKPDKRIMHNPPSLDALPDDVWGEIASFLNVTSIGALSQTSTRWHQHLKRETTWKRLFERQHPELNGIVRFKIDRKLDGVQCWYDAYRFYHSRSWFSSISGSSAAAVASELSKGLDYFGVMHSCLSRPPRFSHAELMYFYSLVFTLKQDQSMLPEDVTLMYRRALRRYCLLAFASLAGLRQNPSELLRLYCRVYKRYRMYVEAISFVFQSMVVWLRSWDPALPAEFLARDALGVFQDVISSALNSSVDAALAGESCHFGCSHQKKARCLRAHLCSGNAALPKLWQRHDAGAAGEGQPAPAAAAECTRMSPAVARVVKKAAPSSPTTVRTADGQTFNIGVLAQQSSVLRRLLALGN